MYIAKRKDFIAGVLYSLIGGAVALMSMDYRMGEASAMGPGYFPFWLGMLLFLTGLVVAVRDMRSASAAAEAEARFELRSICVISLSVILFGAALFYLGLLAAVVLMTTLAICAIPGFSWRFAAALSAALLLIAFVVFIWGLSLPLPILPPFLG